MNLSAFLLSPANFPKNPFFSILDDVFEAELVLEPRDGATLLALDLALEWAMRGGRGVKIFFWPVRMLPAKIMCVPSQVLYSEH